MEQLPWLPHHPDLRTALRQAQSPDASTGRMAAAVALSGFRRDFLQTNTIDRLALTEGDGAVSSPPLLPVRVALLASHSVDHLLPGIRVAGLSRGLRIDIRLAPYGLYRQLAVATDPDLGQFAPHLILLALDAQSDRFGVPPGATAAEAAEAVALQVAELRNLWQQLRQRYGAQIVQQTFISTAPSVFGALDGLVPASPRALLAALNNAVRKAARTDGVLLLDIEWHLASALGTGALVDSVRWHQAKQLIAPQIAPLYGDHVARLAGAVLGRSRKCLILDLDDTLWGGVVGDDGVEGLRLGQGSAEGEAFLAMQHYALQLAGRGILLAICSKNEQAIAEAAFRDHPDMLLRPEHVAAFVANWNDKAGNIRQIARHLGIGLDSMVFVDDNPAERDIVRRELPEVAVPELPDDVANYPALLAAAGYFELVSFSTEDAARTNDYRLNDERSALLARSTDMAGYLSAMGMTLGATRLRPGDIGRATQLLNKSNQYNLTTRRYTEVQMAQLADDPHALALALRLKDRFGDNGLISVIVARQDPDWAADDLLIDSWLMSCRVLARGVERAALAAIVAEAAKYGARSLIGEFRPTARNGMVAAHYSGLGFQPEPAPPGALPGASFWRFRLDDPLPPHFIALERQA